MKRIIVVVFILFSAANLQSQEIPTFITDSLDIYVNRALSQWEIPGAAVVIVKDGKVIVSKGYGVKAIGSEDKVDENTLFMIGSNTKAFTGTALAILEHEEKLKLDDKVKGHFPEFKMYNDMLTNEINLVDIISHRMGFDTFQGDFMYWTSDLTADQVIDKFGKLKPMFDFRTKWGYTNAGYAVAGKVIENVSGIKWENYVKEKILMPMGMHRTTALSVEYPYSTNIAKPHTFVDGKMSVIEFENLDNMAPCGSMGSSVSDMSRWIIAQLDSGRLDGETVLPYSIIKRTYTPSSIERRANHPFNRTNYLLYGLGWELQDYEGREIVSHTGGVNGFVTSVTLIPKENLGIVVLTNNDQNAFFQMVKWEIIDAYLGLPYRDYNTIYFERNIIRMEKQEKILAELRDSVSLNLKPKIDLSDFTGRYEHDVYGFADLQVEQNSLLLKLQHHTKITGRLEYIGNERFLCTYSDPTYGIRVFPFKIKDGRVISFDLYVNEFIEYLPYTFVKK